MVPLKLCGDQHEVRDTSISRHLVRVLRNPNIFTYFNFRHRTLCIAEWVLKSGGLCMELHSIPEGTDPRGPVGAVIEGKSPRSREFYHWRAAAIRGEVRDDLNAQQEDADNHVAAVEWLRKRRGIHYSDHPHWNML